MAERTLEEILVNLRGRIDTLVRRSAGGGGGRGGGGGAMAMRGTTAQRDAVLIPPTNDAEVASLANRQVLWFNTDHGWFECYYALATVPGLTVRGLLPLAVNGWYPMGGSLIAGHWGKTSGSVPATKIGNFFWYNNYIPQMLVGGLDADSDPTNGGNGFHTPFAGFYRLRFSVYTWETKAFDVRLWIRVDGVKRSPFYQNDVIEQGNTVAFEVLLPVRAGAWCQVQYEAIASDSGDANWTWTANDAYKGFDGTHMEAQYVGPPLANDN
jgi:hypothetical protein